MIQKFLIADDDPDDIDLFSEALRDIESSIEFNFAGNGKELIEKLKAPEVSVPQIIFLDINMPKMNGWECLDVLNTDQNFRDIPVLMYSTSSSIADGRKAVESGAIGFYEKPLSFLQLREFLAMIVASDAANLKTRLSEIASAKSHKLFTG